MENEARDFDLVKSDSTVITFFISVDVDSYWGEDSIFQFDDEREFVEEMNNA